MRKLLIGLGIIIVALIVLALVVPMLIPAEIYRDRIVAVVEAATGRQVHIGGPVKIRLIPNVAIEANAVALDNAPGGVATEMATLGKLQVGVRLLPLIGGTIDIDRFVLVDPVIHLEVAKDGRPNWQFAPAQAVPPTPAAPSPQPGNTPSAAMRQLQLGEVKLVNGTVDYFDARNNARYAADQIGVTVDLPGLDRKSTVDGSLMWRGKPVKLSLQIERPLVLVETGSSPAKLNVTSDPVKFSFDGTVAGGQALKLDGALSLDAPSLRDLANWAGAPIKLGGSGLGAFSFKSKLVAAGKSTALTDIALTLDAIKASGDLSLVTGGALPAVKGKLAVNMLDLNPYLARPPKDAAAAPSGPPAPTESHPSAKEWSNEPIDVTALKGIDADIAIAADGVRYGNIEIGKGALGITLQAGTLTVALNELQLYGGSGKGRIAVDGAGPVPALNLSFALSGIQAQPLLAAAIDLDRVTGTGQLNLDLSSRGRSQRELIGALSGKGAFSFANGAVRGIDLTAMTKNAAQAVLQAAIGGNQQTAFSELSGTFTAANGIIRNDDLALKSGVGDMGGSGTVDLPHRSVDYRIEPKLVVNAQNVAVPILIKGPWTNLTYQPDVRGLIGNNAGKLLQGLTGKTGSGAAPSSNKPADILRGLLGGK